MTPREMRDLRERLGWSRVELARRLEVSSSRLADYEVGQSRNKPPQPAPIPKTVELACRWLEEHARPLSPEEKVAPWSDDRNWPQYSGPPIDDHREAIYDEPRGQ